LLSLELLDEDELPDNYCDDDLEDEEELEISEFLA
jgi:hypothetical protein